MIEHALNDARIRRSQQGMRVLGTHGGFPNSYTLADEPYLEGQRAVASRFVSPTRQIKTTVIPILELLAKLLYLPSTVAAGLTTNVQR